MALVAAAEPDQERPGASPLLFGTILFLASELLFFGGLFGAYFALRARTSPWPPEGVELDTMVSAVATALLLLSSGTFHLATTRAGRADIAGLRTWIAVTLGLGSVFLGFQLYDYSRLAFEVSSHAYGTMYFAMTGLHGLHVLAGLVLMLVVLARAAQGAYRDGGADGVHAVGYYWHFVDVVWLGLFATLFLVR
ncbi:MAG TPA: heme-copper oxidase subunit III [Actinomycetota bacterium]